MVCRCRSMRSRSSSTSMARAASRASLSSHMVRIGPLRLPLLGIGLPLLKLRQEPQEHVPCLGAVHLAARPRNELLGMLANELLVFLRHNGHQDLLSGVSSLGPPPLIPRLHLREHRGARLTGVVAEGVPPTGTPCTSS